MSGVRVSILGAAVCGAGVTVLVGCQALLFDDSDYQIQVPAQLTHMIDSIDLAEHSSTAPVNIEQATEAMAREAMKPHVSPAMLDLSLGDLRATALANNLDLKVELINPALAQTTVDEEEAKFEAAFTGSAQRNSTDSPTALETQGSRSEFDRFALGVNIPLRTGGTVNVDFPFNKTETNNPFSLLNPAYDSNLRFSISQPLLRGGGVRSNTHSIRIARNQKSIADARTKLEAIRILAAADRAYWNLYAARRELEVRQQQYELAVEQLEQAVRKVQAGDVPEIEVTRAQSGVAQRLEAIIIAHTVVKQRQRDIKRIMNRDDLPINGPTTLVTTTDPNPVGLDLDPDVMADFAIVNRMEMLELELQLASDLSTIDFQRNQALPLFTVDYSYSLSGLGSSYNSAFDQVFDNRFQTWSLGANMQVPLGNEAAEARVHRAIFTRLQRLATRAQRDLAIRQEVFDALDQLQQNWQRILAARQAAILEGLTYEAETRQFNVGLRTSTDVLIAAAQLADAQSAEIRALTDYQISLIDIAFASGTLLGHGRVIWAAPTQSELEDEHGVPASKPLWSEIMERTEKE